MEAVESGAPISSPSIPSCVEEAIKLEQSCTVFVIQAPASGKSMSTMKVSGRLEGLIPDTIASIERTFGHAQSDGDSVGNVSISARFIELFEDRQPIDLLHVHPTGGGLFNGPSRNPCYIQLHGSARVRGSAVGSVPWTRCGGVGDAHKDAGAGNGGNGGGYAGVDTQKRREGPITIRQVENHMVIENCFAARYEKLMQAYSLGLLRQKQHNVSKLSLGTVFQINFVKKKSLKGGKIITVLRFIEMGQDRTRFEKVQNYMRAQFQQPPKCRSAMARLLHLGMDGPEHLLFVQCVSHVDGKKEYTYLGKGASYIPQAMQFTKRQKARYNVEEMRINKKNETDYLERIQEKDVHTLQELEDELGRRHHEDYALTNEELLTIIGAKSETAQARAIYFEKIREELRCFEEIIENLGSRGRSREILQAHAPEQAPELLSSSARSFLSDSLSASKSGASPRGAKAGSTIPPLDLEKVFSAQQKAGGTSNGDPPYKVRPKQAGECSGTESESSFGGSPMAKSGTPSKFMDTSASATPSIPEMSLGMSVGQSHSLGYHEQGQANKQLNTQHRNASYKWASRITLPRSVSMFPRTVSYKALSPPIGAYRGMMDLQGPHNGINAAPVGVVGDESTTTGSQHGGMRQPGHNALGAQEKNNHSVYSTPVQATGAAFPQGGIMNGEASPLIPHNLMHQGMLLRHENRQRHTMSTTSLHSLGISACPDSRQRTCNPSPPPRMIVQRGDDAGHVDELFASNGDFVNPPTVGKPLMANGHTTSMIQLPMGAAAVSSNIDQYGGQQMRKSFSNADLQQRQVGLFTGNSMEAGNSRGVFPHRITHVPGGTPPLGSTSPYSGARNLSPDSSLQRHHHSSTVLSRGSPQRYRSSFKGGHGHSQSNLGLLSVDMFTMMGGTSLNAQQTTIPAHGSTSASMKEDGHGNNNSNGLSFCEKVPNNGSAAHGEKGAQPHAVNGQQSHLMDAQSTNIPSQTTTRTLASMVSKSSRSGMSGEATPKPEQTKFALKTGSLTDFRMNTSSNLSTPLCPLGRFPVSDFRMGRSSAPINTDAVVMPTDARRFTSPKLRNFVPSTSSSLIAPSTGTVKILAPSSTQNTGGANTQNNNNSGVGNNNNGSTTPTGSGATGHASASNPRGTGQSPGGFPYTNPIPVWGGASPFPHLNPPGRFIMFSPTPSHGEERR